MKDFITYDIKSELTRSNIYDKATDILPDFKWRKGHSDSQGKYVSGMNERKIEIQLWLGEPLLEMSVSFTRVWVKNPNRNSKKEQFIELLETKFIPKIGINLNKAEFV